jgi:hypothetical protein
MTCGLSFFENWIVTNVCAFALCFLAAALAAVAVLSAHPIVVYAAIGGAVIALICAGLVFYGHPTRLRIYQLLAARIARHGFSESDVLKFSGQICLSWQALYLLWRHRRMDMAKTVLTAPWRERAVFVPHTNPAIEEAINFGDPLPEGAFEQLREGRP